MVRGGTDPLTLLIRPLLLPAVSTDPDCLLPQPSRGALLPVENGAQGGARLLSKVEGAGAPVEWEWDPADWLELRVETMVDLFR